MPARPYALAFSLFTVVASGCATHSGAMSETDEPLAAPADDEAKIVFMRPSSQGAGVRSHVFDTTSEDTVYLGTVPVGGQLTTTVDPGTHYFMVTSEAADFMRANVDGSETYYAIVRPRWGFSVRFSLVPVNTDPDARFYLGSDEFAAWRDEMQTVRLTPEAEEEAAARMDRTNDLRERYWERWQEKPDADKAKVTLQPTDAVSR